jgi:hypothetical protein
VSLTAPNGDPGALYSYATQLEMAATGASSLGTDTPATMSSIQQKAKWTGQAATVCLALGGDLGSGVADTSVPLRTMAAAVRSYAGALSNAQAKVSAYNRSATDAEVAGWTDAGTSAVMQAAASDAQTALTAWQQAGDQAASQVASATKQLGDVFAAGKPVRTYLASLPAEINPYAVPSSTATGLATSGLPVSSDYLLSPEATSRPAPPPATEDQPFAYLFRQVVEPEGEPVPVPVYDPESQVSVNQDKKPLPPPRTFPTVKRVRKEKKTVVKGVPDTDYDFDDVPDPGPA